MKSAYEEVQENNSWSRVHMCAVKGERDSQALTSGLPRVSVFHVQAIWNHRILTIKYSSKSPSAYGAQGHNKSQRCIWCRFCQRNAGGRYVSGTRTTNNPELWSWIGIIAYPNGDLQWCDCTSGPFQVRSRRSNFPPWGREKYHVRGRRAVINPIHQPFIWELWITEIMILNGTARVCRPRISDRVDETFHRDDENHIPYTRGKP